MAQVAKGVLGGGLEPPCLTAYAPQTYVSAISPPEQIGVSKKYTDGGCFGKAEILRRNSSLSGSRRESEILAAGLTGQEALLLG